MSCVRVAIHLACAIGRRCGVLRRSCANSPTNEPSLLLLPLPLLPASGKKRSRLQAASDSEEEQAEAPAEGAGEGEGEGELGGDAADDAADDVSSAAPQIPVPPLHSTVTFFLHQVHHFLRIWSPSPSVSPGMESRTDVLTVSPCLQTPAAAKRRKVQVDDDEVGAGRSCCCWRLPNSSCVPLGAGSLFPGQAQDNAEGSRVMLCLLAGGR